MIYGHSARSLTFAPFDVSWVPNSSRIITLGQNKRGTGTIQIYAHENREFTIVGEVEKRAAFKCCTFQSSTLRRLATGDFEGKLCLWDIERLEIPIYSSKAHNQIINCIDGCSVAGDAIGRPEIVTGSRDGTIQVWDIRQESTPVLKIEPKEGEVKRDCWTVSFGQSYGIEDRCICAGFDNGDLSLFDLRNNSISWQINVGVGICSTNFDSVNTSSSSILWTGVSGKYGVVSSSGTINQTSELQNSKSTIWCGKFLPQKSIVGVSDGDGHIQLFKKDEKSGYTFSEKLKIAKKPLGSFSWSSNKPGLFAATSFDQVLQVGFVTDLEKQ